MEYDPIKYRLAKLLGGSCCLWRLFFFTLDLLFLRAWYVRRELKLLVDRIGAGATLLDAGMGFGQYSERMLKLFEDARLVGLEIDLKHTYGSVQYFRRRYTRAHVVLGDVQAQPLAAEKFDLALTVDVMEHIADDKAAFAEYARVLKPGGFLLMHTPRIVEPHQEVGSRKSEVGSLDGAQSVDYATSDFVTSPHWHVDEHMRDGYYERDACERLDIAGLRVVKVVRGYGWAGRIAWTLLQRIPLCWLVKGRLMLLPVAVYMLPALPLGLLFMWLDYIKGDHPRGGSLLVLAQKPVLG